MIPTHCQIRGDLVKPTANQSGVKLREVERKPSSIWTANKIQWNLLFGGISVAAAVYYIYRGRFWKMKIDGLPSNQRTSRGNSSGAKAGLCLTDYGLIILLTTM